jgi:4-hydroxy-3-polyprenylbenzoate decarboxylase
MTLTSLQECVRVLEKEGELRRISAPVDPKLELAEIHRRVFRSEGPALFFENVRGTQFPVLANLFGTSKRARRIFEGTLDSVRSLVVAKTDPKDFFQAPLLSARLPFAAAHLLPLPTFRADVLKHDIRIRDLPQFVSWPDDGGPFITLPQVYSEDPERPGVRASNLGMYRVQLAGNDYVQDREIGLHYQLHRGIGVHHTAAARLGKPLRVNVFVGGPPAMALAAVMPLPEGLPELSFAGALNGRSIRVVREGENPAIHADADFCIQGYILPQETKAEGPFGDHLGYYAKTHPFPLFHVERVTHKPGAIWPLTTVGRPPQEDTLFGELIHELTAPLVPTVLPGVHAVHAVDASGVHPLLFAIGSERYAPYLKERRPMELLTQANGILGQGQMSLAKYVWIAAKQDNERLDIHNVQAFLMHMLERIDLMRDLHFQTRTTMDTLDYSGTGINEGSKLVLAAVGDKRRTLVQALPAGLALPEGFSDPRIAMPGVLAVRGPAWAARPSGRKAMQRLENELTAAASLEGMPLVIVCDDSEFVSRTVSNFIWVTFTRSNPAADIFGVGKRIVEKHWGCSGPLLIDARKKTHHAPALVEDPAVTKAVERFFVRGGALAGIEKA